MQIATGTAAASGLLTFNVNLDYIPEAIMVTPDVGLPVNRGICESLNVTFNGDTIANVTSADGYAMLAMYSTVRHTDVSVGTGPATEPTIYEAARRGAYTNPIIRFGNGRVKGACTIRATFRLAEGGADYKLIEKSQGLGDKLFTWGEQAILPSQSKTVTLTGGMGSIGVGDTFFDTGNVIEITYTNGFVESFVGNEAYAWIAANGGRYMLNPQDSAAPTELTAIDKAMMFFTSDNYGSDAIFDNVRKVTFRNQSTNAQKILVAPFPPEILL